MDHSEQSTVPFIQPTFCLPAFCLLVAKAIPVCLDSVTVLKLGVVSFKKNAFYNCAIKNRASVWTCFSPKGGGGEQSL